LIPQIVAACEGEGKEAPLFVISSKFGSSVPAPSPREDGPRMVQASDWHIVEAEVLREIEVRRAQRGQAPSEALQ
jgi:hypothetical protein